MKDKAERDYKAVRGWKPRTGSRGSERGRAASGHAHSRARPFFCNTPARPSPSPAAARPHTQNDDLWSKDFMRIVKMTEPMTKMQDALKNQTLDKLTAVSWRRRAHRKRGACRAGRVHAASSRALAGALALPLCSPLPNPNPPRLSLFSTTTPQQFNTWKEDATAKIQARIDEKQKNEAKNDAAVRASTGRSRGRAGRGKRER